MAALIPIFLQFMPYLIQAGQEVPQIITFVSKIHNIFKRSAVWTQEQEDAFDKSVEDLKDDPAWKPEE